MKVNRITFDKIKAEYETIKMRNAYIAAEQKIIQDSVNGFANGLQNIVEERYTQDQFGNIKHEALTLKDVQIEKLEQHSLDLIKAGDKAMQIEDYIKFKEIKELWEKVQKQIKNLRSK